MNNEVLNSFKEVSLKYMGNANSLHKLGVLSKKLEVASTKQISDLLKLNDKEIVYTSDINEANALAILGLVYKYLNKNKRIVAFKNCDDSILDCLDYLKKYAYDIVLISSEDELNNVLDNNTVLVCINDTCNLKYIASLVRKYNMVHLLMEINNKFSFDIDFNVADFYTMDANIINGINGIGCLIKKKEIVLEPVFHGGKSTTSYRSGTPALPFIVSFAKALKVYKNNI